MFIIEDDDDDDEMFGFYLNKEIPLNANYIESDDNYSFHFNLISNGNRLSEPMKFDKKKSKSYYITFFKEKDIRLIQIGDINLFKQDYKEKSYCHDENNNSFYDYKGIESALCGKSGSRKKGNRFIPKRILVIQMI